MFNLNTFDVMDWMSYGGAEPFADGRDPLISVGEVSVDGAPADIIVEGAGVSLNWFLDEQYYCVHINGAEGARFLAAIVPVMTYAQVAALPGVEISRA